MRLENDVKAKLKAKNAEFRKMLGIDACLIVVGVALFVSVSGYLALGAGNFEPVVRRSAGE